MARTRGVRMGPGTRRATQGRCTMGVDPADAGRSSPRRTRAARTDRARVTGTGEAVKASVASRLALTPANVLSGGAA
jgi:hypothetical protein